MPFTEVAPRVWVRRTSGGAGAGPNPTVVGGQRGLVVVDPPDSEGVVDEVRGLGHGALVDVVDTVDAVDVVAAVLTHGHAAHGAGAAAIRAAFPHAVVHVHEAAELPWTRAIDAVETFSSARAIDLGDRAVELVHPGRGHTAGDLVLRVPDADVLVTGDLVVEGCPPGMGEDCFPLEWPATLDLLLGLVTPTTVVVPGHGRVVDRAFVEAQRQAIGTVAQTIHDLAARGVPVGEALDAGEWPYQRASLEHAVRRGYAHLPRGARQLPLA